MPRLSPNLSNTVFFLYEKDPAKPPGSDEYIGPCGTGVIVGRFDIASPTTIHFYAVTAAHVAKSGGSIIKFNTRDGKTRTLEFDPCEWSADLSREDVAVVDFTDRIKVSADGDLINYIPLDMFASEQFLRRVEFGLGEDGFMLGLFSGHSGEAQNPGAQNLIAARFGNVSMLSDSSAPIARYSPELKITFTTPCHIFDMHSRPGYSGSPVFVYRTSDSDLRDLEMRATVKQMIITRDKSTRRNERGGENIELIEHDVKNNRFLKLFGIHVAQFHDEVTISKVDYSEKDAAAELKDGDTIRFPGSMTMIVPAWEVERLIEHDPALARQRQERRTAARQKSNIGN